MKNLLSLLLSKPLFIDEQWVQNYLSNAQPHTMSDRSESAIAKELPLTLRHLDGSLVNLAEAKVGSLFSEAPEGSVAVINISGVMMKEDYIDYWEYKYYVGTATIARIIQEADAAENISGIVLVLDSPGGSVDGTEALANAIKGTSTPIVAHVDFMAASACYWAASQTDNIVMGGETSMLGSIGTMITIINADGFYNRFSITIHKVRATKSVDKNRAFDEAKEGKYELIRSELLDPLNQVFLTAVKNGRRGKINLKKEDVLTGKMYVGQAAIDAGLADAIGTIETSLTALSNGKTDRAKALEGDALSNAIDSDLHLVTTSKISNMKFTIKSAFTALAAFFGLEAGQDHEVEAMTPEQAEQLNARLAAGDAANAELTTLKDTTAKLQALVPQGTTDLVAAFTQMKAERDQFASEASGGAEHPAGGKGADAFGGKKTEMASYNKQAMAKFQNA